MKQENDQYLCTVAAAQNVNAYFRQLTFLLQGDFFFLKLLRRKASQSSLRCNSVDTF